METILTFKRKQGETLSFEQFDRDMELPVTFDSEDTECIFYLSLAECDDLIDFLVQQRRLVKS